MVPVANPQPAWWIVSLVVEDHVVDGDDKNKRIIVNSRREHSFDVRNVTERVGVSWERWRGPPVPGDG